MLRLRSHPLKTAKGGAASRRLIFKRWASLRFSRCRSIPRLCFTLPVVTTPELYAIVEQHEQDHSYEHDQSPAHDRCKRDYGFHCQPTTCTNQEMDETY